MRDKTKQLLVINTGEKKQSASGGQTIVNQYSSYGAGGGGVDLRDYLLKRIWDTVWELRTTEEGESYIYCKLPFLAQFGITSYADGGNVDLPSLYAGIPVDGTTITKTEDGTLMLNPNLELGLDEEALQKYLDDYNYAKLSDIPSLEDYAKLTDIDDRIDDLINGAPAAYDTLKEIADVLEGNINSIADILTALGLKADKTELENYIPIKGDTEVEGVKDFLNGLKIAGLPISKYKDYDDVIYLDANLVVRGGITAYVENEVNIPSILDALPRAGYYDANGAARGIAAFDGKYFSINDGKVTLIEDSVGLNEDELTTWLANSDYATKTYVSDNYATKSSLNTTNSTLATKWTQDNAKISNWDTAYNWGNHASAGYFLAANFNQSNIKSTLGISDWALEATKPSYTTKEVAEDTNLYFTEQRAIDALEDTLKAYVTLKGTQTIEGEKDFTGGLKVNGSPIVYDTENKYWKFQGNLLVTGGITSYYDDGSLDLPSIYDGIPIDGSTIYWEYDSDGNKTVLKAKVAEGGITSITDTMIIDALGYTPYDATNPNGYATQSWVNSQGFLTEHQDLSAYLTKTSASSTYQTKITSSNLLSYYLLSNTPDLSVYATQTWVEDKGYLTAHQSLDGYVNEITTNGTGNAVTSISKSGKKLTFTKGATYLTTTVANGLYHPLITESAKLPTSKISGLATVATSGSYNDLSDKPTIPTSLKNPYALSWSGYSSGSYDGSAAKSITIPTNTNQLTNGAGFITSSGFSSGVLDYNNTTSPIRIGYTSTGLTASNALQLAAYGKDANNHTIIKDISKAEVQSWLGLGSNAYNSTAYQPLATAINTGNIGSQSVNYATSAGNADTLDGLHWGSFMRQFGYITSANNGNALLAGTFRFQEVSGTGLPSGATAYGTMLTARGGDYDTLWQLYGNYNNDGLFYRRGNLTGIVSNAWKQIAFTDSNVASATKLQTARTIWGQSFDGTGDVNGTMLLNVGSILAYYDENAKSYKEFIRPPSGVSGGANLIIGRYNADYDYALSLCGKSMVMYTGSWGSASMVIDNLGNVGVGTTSPACKLHIVGSGDLIRLGSTGSYSCISYIPTGGLVWTAGASNPDYFYIYNNYYGGNVMTLNTTGNMTLVGSMFLNAGNYITNRATLVLNSNKGNAADIIFKNGSTVAANFGTMAISVRHESDFRLSIFRGVENGNIASEAELFKFYPNGNFLSIGGITSYSDIRKKEKLQDVQLTLKQIADAPLIEHYYKHDDKKTTHVGSIAQYWAEMNDWFCKKDSEGYYTMEIQNAALASAISIARELVKYESKTDRTIRLLKKRINQLEDEIENLKKGA